MDIMFQAMVTSNYTGITQKTKTGNWFLVIFIISEKTLVCKWEYIFFYNFLYYLIYNFPESSFVLCFFLSRQKDITA